MYFGGGFLRRIADVGQLEKCTAFDWANKAATMGTFADDLRRNKWSAERRNLAGLFHLHTALVGSARVARAECITNTVAID